ncbi:mutagen-sensitive 301 isoform X2 [Megachile rotundata]|uniref:mutagen-sensitive 301 isoform X2 n=1 Tax=Megachile rotundata TaxID=143995 RepID=UPI003FD02CBD
MIVDIITMQNTNSFLNHSHSKDQYEIVPKPLEVIDSILSMDDTILKSIEDDDNIPFTTSPKVHDKTLHNFAHEWQNTIKAQETTKEFKGGGNNKLDLPIETEKVNNISTEGNSWQDNTFLNEVFTQLESSIKKDDDHEHFIEVLTQTTENYTKESVFVENVDVSRKEHHHVNSKRSLNEYNNVIPSKIHYSNDKKINKRNSNLYHSTSIKDDRFYGLPSAVKQLFSQIRGIDTLYEWQDECLSLDAVKNRKNLIYALPTSGGKTLVAEILMLKEVICNKRNAIFILPFVAIVQEKVQAMAPFALELDFLIEEYAASKGAYPPKKRRKKNSIYMCTIEKALGLINSLIEEKRFKEIGLIVVDELHLIGEGGGRGATLEVILTKALSLEAHKTNEKQNLLNALEREEGLCPILQKTIRFGVAYHHSGLTAEERRLLEDAFKAGTLCVICCTSTLAAGVNLPARRVILRSPYVGSEFINLSRYKQMSGRAGRAGMGDIGESIIICKNNELPKVKELLESKMDDCISSLHVNKDRGINNLILSAILYSIAKTRFELQKLATRTLLNIQQERLGINIKHIVDSAITELLKSGVIKVKDKSKSIDVYQPNITVAIPSQITCPNESDIEKKVKKSIQLMNDTKLDLCNLGRAAMKGCIDIQCAYTLYEDLKKAQEHLVLIDYLHLLYLVTPYDIIPQVKVVGSVYYDVVINLSETQMKTARVLGINEVAITKIRDGLMPKNVEPRVVQRFYVTLILYDLWCQHAVYTIAEKYQVNRGTVQNLLSAVSTFAFSVVRFCQELDEFWAFKDLLDAFSKKLSYCCPLELEALMDLPLVKIGRARQLYNAGFKTVQCIAKVQPKELLEKVPYLSKKTATHIIEAAKLIILEKIQNLEEETEDILDGINIKNLKRV